MLKHIHTAVLTLILLLSTDCLRADDAPTERTEDCISSECHNSYVQKRHVHKPVAHGVCKFCHKYVDPKEHSFELFRTRKELCGSCHEKQTRDLTIIPSVEQLAPKALVDKGKYLHEPLREGKCIDCHEAHSSDYEFLLPSAEIGGSCLRDCHEINQYPPNPHEPVADGECDLCHSSHSSDYSHLLIDEERRLCISCHEDTQAELDAFEYIHPPVMTRGCRDCHAPHGSDYFRLLVRQYPSEFYAPFDISNYDLCFSCHQEDKVLVKETEDLTDFRNGTANLHYLHVNMPEKGRTCRTCHATHASDEPKHLRKSVPYGGWGIPILFEKTETGGGCSPGCHDSRAYDRMNPVRYLSKDL